MWSHLIPKLLDPGHRVKHDYDRNMKCKWCDQKEDFLMGGNPAPWCFRAPEHLVKASKAEMERVKKASEVLYRGCRRGGFA